jgi:hypothetical protein
LIFHKNFHPTTVSESDSESVSESELSDSDPAKTFGLFRIRIHNTGAAGNIILSIFNAVEFMRFILIVRLCEPGQHVLSERLTPGSTGIAHAGYRRHQCQVLIGWYFTD